jgi:hypothetical protein
MLDENKRLHLMDGVNGHFFAYAEKDVLEEIEELKARLNGLESKIDLGNFDEKVAQGIRAALEAIKSEVEEIFPTPNPKIELVEVIDG